MRNENNMSNFITSVATISPKTNKDIYFLFYKDELLVKSEDNKAVIPEIQDLDNLKINNIQYLGSINGQNCFCGELNENDVIPNDMYFSKLKALTHQLSEDMFWIGGRAIQLVNFNNDHRYCGRCGAFTNTVDAIFVKKVVV